MISPKKLTFLYEMGLNEVQIRIYKFLLESYIENRNNINERKSLGSSIEEIKKGLNIAYSTAEKHLQFLKRKHLVEIDSSGRYIRKTPKIGISELLNERIDNYNDSIKELEEELKIKVSKFGRCLRDITFYHYSDVNLAIDNFFDLIEKTQKEIVITALPISFLRRLKSILNDAFLSGVKITIYYSILDIERDNSYFEKLIELFNKSRVKIVETKQKTCQVIRYNDEIVNMGNILLDEIYLNSIIFREEEVFLCNGFMGPFAKQTKHYLEILEQIKTWEIEFPDPINNVIEIIKEYNSIKTRDLSFKSKVGGTKLKEILDFLTLEGLIKEEIIKNETAGRPKHVYSLVE